MFQGAWKVSISMQIKNSINENCTICKESQMRMTIANVSEISLYLLAQETPLIVRFVSLTETCSANSSLLEVGVVGVAGSQGPVCFSAYPSTFYCFIHSSVKKFGEICESLQGICQPQNTNWNESRIHLDQVSAPRTSILEVGKGNLAAPALQALCTVVNRQ